MIFEMFWKWLTHDKRKYCEHDWEYTGHDFTSPYGRLYYKIDQYKCNNCGKKEHRPSDDTSVYKML